MELYRKIYIKSEEDLPKEVGNYITSIGTKLFNPKELKIKPLQSDSVEYWIYCITWYLQPIDITNADIEAWAEKYIKDSYLPSDLIFIKKLGIGIGAIAMRDGEIKHNDK